MYEPFYGLRERPFDLTPNPRFLVWTQGHREALSNLEYAIASRKGITVLVGQAGVGKTTVIRTALEFQESRVHCVHVQNPALTRDEFVHLLATRFGLSAEAQVSKSALLGELEAMLRRRHATAETTVLLIDEAQSMSRELLEELRLLENIETDEQKLLTLVLAGQPELADVLNQDALRQMKQRVALRCELRALTLEETCTYIAGRILAAGGKPKNIFTREAVVHVFERSGGIPRTINVLSDNALIVGFACGRTIIDSKIVQEVAQDFDFYARTSTESEPARRHQPLRAPESTAPEIDHTSAAPAPRFAVNSILATSPTKRGRFSFLGRGQSA